MRRTLYTCALLAVGALASGCGFKVFEDIGSDPHPPTVEILAIAHYVKPPPATPDAPATTAGWSAATAAVRGAAPTAPRSVVWDSGGFTVSMGQLFQITTAYTDAGADIVEYKLRDRDGKNDFSLTPPEGSTYFPGTGGEITHSVDGLEMDGVLGPHRMELWAEDTHGSRSEKVEFVITLTL
jgi:hypothetical protein